MALGLSRAEVVQAAGSGLRKQKWILQVKLLKKKKMSGPGRTMSSVYLLLKEKKKKVEELEKEIKNQT